MLAVHFGAGNIGRGFIGLLLSNSGYDTVFVDVNKEIVDLLNTRKEYQVVLAAESKEEVTVQNVSALNSMLEPEKVIDVIAKADIVTTAVGPNILPMIAPLLAKGLIERLKTNANSLNVIACENLIGGSTLLKKHVLEHLDEEVQKQMAEVVAFPDAAVDRIVPNQHNEDKLLVMVEPYYEWVVDQSMMIGEKPAINGITFVEALDPYIERKLWTVNTGHAVAAYLGYHYGIKSIDQAIRNDEVRSLIEKTLQETGTLLTEKHSFDPEEHAIYINKIIARFKNEFLADDVTRVGRGPLRKLGATDRLVGPAKQYLDLVGKEPVYLAKAIAAAFSYDVQTDEEAVQIQQKISSEGLEATIHAVTGLEENNELFKLIVDQYKLLNAK
ncbi:mannitol-1-phosphate 5-dehydrogenase [Halalkalibacter akibai]|uniref:Mannitol-1-phosphate 5-dehydrogenase n=1 Tax=Halalkalibacter akibai (strain ATCC 43226 / DSM 21942 / CIP 109018 / JCM 9157 / 1139) TaxID=1236973 RepID=W4QYY1_HALA3|nr:mannitol-1-phosphate 5-dehydrogenase [Halalkalibacter akibai]GAE36878.1 mannitol-1-phosphate 5-dehydrogenase [Halalkalibacter akibai JCM 9157]